MRWKSCDLTSVSRHHRSLWLSDAQQNDACVISQENFRAACEMSKSLHDRQNFNFSAVRYWNRRKINICWSISEIFFIFNFISVLYHEIVESLQQHHWSAKYKHFCRWHHAASLQTNHWEKLSNFQKHAWLMYELNLLLWNILCIREIWSDSSVQKTQEVQHASSAAARKSSQSFHNISSCAENLTELKAVMKWACESSAWQNEDSNQCSCLHHSFHLRCHLCQRVADLQCNHQISISSWSSYLTFTAVRKTEKQKNITQRFCSQNDKHSEQMLVNNVWSLLCNFNLSAENRNIHLSA